MVRWEGQGGEWRRRRARSNSTLPNLLLLHWLLLLLHRNQHSLPACLRTFHGSRQPAPDWLIRLCVRLEQRRDGRGDFISIATSADQASIAAVASRPASAAITEQAGSAASAAAAEEKATITPCAASLEDGTRVH